MGAIYCYTNLINGKKYIGQTINDPRIRKNQHKSNHLNTKSPEYDSLIHRAFRKYGYENFKYEILIDGINDIEMLNQFEIYFIKLFNTQRPNGYNIESGGKNSSKPKTEQQKIKLMWSHGKLSETEVIELRKAYQRKESPKKIYDEFYKDRLHYNSFLNIWDGRRYGKVMPEVFNKGRHTKLTAEIVHLIKEDRKKLKLSYQKIADKYNISKSTVADICTGRTWKEVQ